MKRIAGVADVASNLSLDGLPHASYAEDAKAFEPSLGAFRSRGEQEAVLSLPACRIY